MEIPEAPDKEMWAKTVSTAVMVKGNEGKIYGGGHAAGVWSVTVVLGITPRSWGLLVGCIRFQKPRIL